MAADRWPQRNLRGRLGAVDLLVAVCAPCQLARMSLGHTSAAVRSFRLLSSGWGEELDSAVSLGANSVDVICPFIKASTAQRFLKVRPPKGMRVLTRFNLRCFNDGVSDVEALRSFLRAGASVRGIRGLHSKLYVFGSKRVIVTSANLTEAAMTRNHEFGFVSNDDAIIIECAGYFDELWKAAGANLTTSQIEQWQSLLDEERRVRPTGQCSSLPDFGVAVTLPSPFTTAGALEMPDAQAFLKFFGTAGNRLDPSESVADVVESSGCNWACTYPPNKRPRQVQDGDTIFMGRLCNNGDLLIFGRAVGRQHRPGIDEATAEEIEDRSWKSDWPIYVRVHSGRFLNGRLADGVSLREMMRALGSDTYMSTQRNAVRGRGNTIPSRSMMQKAHMQLSAKASEWLSQRLEESFRRHGELDLSEPS